MNSQLRNSLVLLRFPFSVFLLPVFFFAWSQVKDVNAWKLAAVFLILHVLVYPSSNGYNSYMDRDTGSIGGLEKPPEPNKLLFYITIGMDLLAIGLSMLVSIYFLGGLLVYIVSSRLYSYRGIRLKQYPIMGFLTVFLVQGAITYYMIFKGINADETAKPALLCMLISSLLLGALYPLTQIYQHEQDKADGVTSISYLLGYKGTFAFSAVLFVSANVFLYLYFSGLQQMQSFIVITVALLPAVAYFLYWMFRVFRDTGQANFKNSLRMNVIASLCTNIGFMLLTILKYWARSFA